jgi:DNA invertase Pin-like site-specific DNA recombinase
MINKVLMVTRLDRLARSTRDLLNVLAAITGAGFRSLKDTWADTTTPHGRLMLTVLGGLAEFERELIRVRTGEGRERTRTAGVRFGRPCDGVTIQLSNYPTSALPIHFENLTYSELALSFSKFDVFRQLHTLWGL